MAKKTAFPFGALMPGFDFMNQLASAGARSAGAPGLQHWIAPTVDIDELERRITELKTVQFWLEQNLLGIKASIQALEVQKMTLQTLQGMNLSMGEIAKAFTLPTDTAKADQPRPAEKPAGKEPDADKGTASKTDKTAAAPTAALADPLQWWGSLSEQFQKIATQALQDAATHTLPPSPVKKDEPKKATAKKTARKKSTSRATAPKARKTPAKTGTAAKK